MKYKTKKNSCPDCKKKEPNQIIFTQSGIAHLRCPECNSVNLYSVKKVKKETKTAKNKFPKVKNTEAISTAAKIAETETTVTVTPETETTETENSETKTTASKETIETAVEETAIEEDKTEIADPDNDTGTEKISSLIEHSAVMEKNKKKCAPYGASNDYSVGDYFHHKTFGDGYVLDVLPSQKMSVLFTDQKRLLRCGPNSQKAEIIQFGQKSAQSVDAENDTSETRVFSTPVTPEKKKRPAQKASKTGTDDNTRECPKCKKVTHVYNLSQNPKGKIVGCMNCIGQ